MNKKLVAIILVTSLFSLAAAADHRGKSDKRRYSNHSSKEHIYDYAKVTSVTPIVETIAHQIPKLCHYQPARHNHNKSATPAILGTIIGAAIGNELGHKKRNKRIGAIAGGILGGSIGIDIGRNNRQQNGEYCDHYDIENEQIVVGYDVSYRYRGKTYYTTTQQHPGRKIQLKLKFEPVFS
ncbi:MAG: YMGG-like glycine zipper-containing protein [Oceanicoccus sp.]